MKSLGYTLIEILLAVLLFSIISVIATQSIVVSLRGSQKSEAIADVRSELSYSLSVMERFLHNAQEITSPEGANTRLDFIDRNGDPASFECIAGSHLEHDGVRLTSTKVTIPVSVCAGIFTYTAAVGGVPDIVEIDITAESTESTGVEGAQETMRTRILLRNYES